MGVARLEKPDEPAKPMKVGGMNVARTVDDRKRAHWEMRCAVMIYPADAKFSDALPLLVAASAGTSRRDDLLIVLQRERKTAEWLALQAGFPPACFGELRKPKERHDKQPRHRRADRGGIFESDVVEHYLPSFLVKVRSNETRRALPPFARHAFRKYRGRLRQIAQRERRRSEMLSQLGGDLRTVIEYTSGVREDADATLGIAPAALSALVPSTEEIQRNNMLLEDLQAELDPFEYRVAELYMAGMIHQGDKSEIAKFLGVSRSRITVATARIEELLERLGYDG